jgi:hypothetical protein
MRPWSATVLCAGILVLGVAFLGEVVPPRPGDGLARRWLATMDAHRLRSWVAWSLLVRALVPTRLQPIAPDDRKTSR